MRNSIATDIENGYAKKITVLCHITDGFFVLIKGIYIKVYYRDLLFIAADKNYCELHLTTKRVYSVYHTMTQLEDWMSIALREPEEFRNDASTMVRISRSIILDLSKVDKIIGNTLYVGEKSFYVAPAYRRRIFECFDVL